MDGILAAQYKAMIQVKEFFHPPAGTSTVPGVSDVADRPSTEQSTLSKAEFKAHKTAAGFVDVATAVINDQTPASVDADPAMLDNAALAAYLTEKTAAFVARLKEERVIKCGYEEGCERMFCTESALLQVNSNGCFDSKFHSLCSYFIQHMKLHYDMELFESTLNTLKVRADFVEDVSMEMVQEQVCTSFLTHSFLSRGTFTRAILCPHCPGGNAVTGCSPAFCCQ